jgi:F-type H+-transporting ATPase subunit a
MSYIKYFNFISIIYVDPIEQFNNNPLTKLSAYPTIIVNNILWIIITMGLLNFWFMSSNINSKINFIKYFIINIQTFIKNIVIETTSLTKNTVYFNFQYIFLLILTLNLLGLLPYSWTVSAWFSFVFYIAHSYFFYILIQGIINKKLTIFENFLPSGTPLIIAPFLVIVEIISYFSRIISLSVRLFANMFSGHSLLKILITFSWKAFHKISIFTTNTMLFNFLLGLVIWCSVTIIFTLECIVALLQTYVFTLLLLIYWNESWTKNH